MADPLSPSALLLQADPVVQGVAAILVAASVACWAIVLDRGTRLLAARRRARALPRFFAQNRSAPTASRSASPTLARAILGAGLTAAQESEPGERRAERRERIERAMRLAMTRELGRLGSGLSLLATIGSTAPFVGLFGTVWGIMHSFDAIAGQESASLAVVAPGIAEALFATALGLAAAIPAVVAYNRMTASLAGTAGLLNAAIAEIGERLSRTGAALSGAA